MSHTVSSLSIGRMLLLFLFGILMLSMGVVLSRRDASEAGAPAVAGESPPHVSPPPVAAEPEAPVARAAEPNLPAVEFQEVDAGTAVAPEVVVKVDESPPVEVKPSPEPVTVAPVTPPKRTTVLGFVADGDAVIHLNGSRIGKGMVLSGDLAEGEVLELRAVGADGSVVARRVVVTPGASTRLVDLRRPAPVAVAPVLAPSEAPTETRPTVAPGGVDAPARRVRVISVTAGARLVAVQSAGAAAPLPVGGRGELVGATVVTVECVRNFGDVSVCRFDSTVPAEGPATLRPVVQP